MPVWFALFFGLQFLVVSVFLGLQSVFFLGFYFVLLSTFAIWFAICFFFLVCNFWLFLVVWFLGFYGSWFSVFWFYDSFFLVFWFMLSFFASGSESGSGSLNLSLCFLAGAGISEGSAAGPTFHRRLSSWLNHEPNFECVCLMLAPI